MKEKERKVKDESYFQIAGWMVNPKKMNLKGLELQLYAIIYGLSQDGEFCHPSIQYFSEFTGATDRGIRKALNKMVEDGIILRRASKEYKTNEYAAVVPNWDEQSSPEEKENPKKGEFSSKKDELSSKKDELSSPHPGTQFTPPRNSVHPTPELSSSNNIDNNIVNNLSDNRQTKEGRLLCSFSDCPNVRLTLSELLFLNRYYGRDNVTKYTKKLELYLEQPGKHIKDHMAAIEKWIIEDAPENQ